MATQSFNPIQAGAQITRDNLSWTALGTGATVTYGFRATAPTSGSEAPTFSKFTAVEIAATPAALQSWSDVANITFTPVNTSGFTDSATMLFANYTAAPTNSSHAHAYQPATKDISAGSVEGDSWMNLQASPFTNVQLGSYDYMTLIHEIGHAIGLDHPGNYNAGDNGADPTYAANAAYVQDTVQYSLMSYFAASNTGANFTFNGVTYNASTPLLDDIAAAQRLYGANTTTRTGDTIYGFNSNAGDAYKITDANAQVVFSIWDAGGKNTLDLSGYSTNQLINLNPGQFSNAGQLIGNISIALGTNIQNAVGGSGNDTIIGNFDDNSLRGGAGNDTIDGGGGVNTSVYSGLSKGFKIAISSPTITAQDRIGTDGTDTLNNIQKLAFSDQTIDLTSFTKTATLSAPQLANLTELYAASFNRAPDAVGLNFWGGQLHDGTTLQDIAKSFFNSAEASAFYPSSQSTSTFVTTVYNNVLGRAPDTTGLNYWVGNLQNGQVTKDVFLLDIINAARSTSGSATDAQFLLNKAAVGQHFALVDGLSDAGWAKTVMSSVTSDVSTVAAANTMSNNFLAIANTTAGAELVIQIVGIAAT